MAAGAEAVLADVEDVVLELVVEEWLEPPHALISRQISASRKVCAECLTFSKPMPITTGGEWCSMRVLTEESSWKLVEYDSMRRRLWILGQRCHHGATGLLVAAIGCAGLLADTSLAARPPGDAKAMLALAATGSVLMVHDWHDHSIWFERGRGTQP